MGLDFLKNPLYNAIISGIIIYILIKVSNRGDPVLGAILSSLPIGVISLLAIKKQNRIQNFYIRSEIITNLIIIIMWIAINIMILYMSNIKHVSMIAILLWIGLSVIFYYTAHKFLPK
mgnify:FL=1